MQIDLKKMKRIILAGIMVGIANWAQATAITILPTGSVISGPYSYIYNEAVTPLASGTTIASASLVFNNIELTVNGPANIPNTLFYDLINVSYASKTISSGESTTDYFQNTAPYDGKGVSDSLGSETLKLNKTVSWTYTFSGQALADLLTDLQKGSFDIGLDPNCVYDIKGSIALDFTTTTNTGKTVVSAPDATMTASMLAFSFLGLLAFRRKLCLN